MEDHLSVNGLPCINIRNKINKLSRGYCDYCWGNVQNKDGSWTMFHEKSQIMGMLLYTFVSAISFGSAE